MTTNNPTSGSTALLIIDPYNDFLHQEGKLNSLLSDSLAECNAISHLKDLLTAARTSNLPVYYGLHQQCTSHSYLGWKHLQKIHISQRDGHAFEQGSWGAEIYEGLEPDLDRGEVVVSKHWSSSSFNNTDLDYQLRQKDVQNLVIAGMTANACVESTARYAYDLGYYVTIITDATAGFTKEQKDAALLCWPLFAKDVTTADQWISSLDKEGEGYAGSEGNKKYAAGGKIQK